MANRFRTTLLLLLLAAFIGASVGCPATGPVRISIWAAQRIGYSGMVVHFNATASPTRQLSDSQSVEVTGWSWNFGDGGTGSGKNPSHQYMTPGVYTVSVTARLASGGTASATFFAYVIVLSHNLPPVANAGPDQTIDLVGNQRNATVTLDGSRSCDQDGRVVAYSWIGIPDPPDVVCPRLTLGAGDYLFSLIVVDDGGAASVPDIVRICVRTEDGNEPPVADAGPDQTVDIPAGQTTVDVTLDGSGSSDPDGTVAAYAWSGTPDPDDIVNPVVTLGGGTHVFTLIVTDDDGAVSAPDTVTITVNTPPVADAGADQGGVFMGDLVTTLDGGASYDDDGDTLSYQWAFTANIPAGSSAALQNATTATPSFTPDRRGTYEIELVVNDGRVDSLPDTVVITVVNRAPVAVPVSLSGDTVLSGAPVLAPDPDKLYATTGEIAFKKLAFPLSELHTLSPVDGTELSAVPIRVFDPNHPYVPIDIVAGPLAADPATGDFWAILGYRFNVFPAPSYYALTKLDPVTGMATHVAYLSETDQITDLAFSGDGTLFGVTGFGAFTLQPVSLYEIDLTDGTCTLRAPLTFTVSWLFEMLAYRTTDGLLYHAANGIGASVFESIDLSQAPPVVTALTYSGDLWLEAVSMTYEPVSGLFFVVRLDAAKIPLPSECLTAQATSGNADFEAAWNSPEGYLGIEFGFTKTYTGQEAVLDGSNSTDADGDPLTYAWSFQSVPAGSAAALDNPSAVSPRFTPDIMGDYVVQLIVSDGLAQSAPATITITYANTPPVADAGPDLAVLAATVVQLNGSGSSDADGHALTYTWTLLSAPPGSAATDANISDVASAVPTITLDAMSDTVPYVLQLTVTDSEAESSSDTVSILNALLN